MTHARQWCMPTCQYKPPSTNRASPPTSHKWGYIWGYLSGGPANKSKRIRDLAAEFDPMPHYRTEPEAWVAGETHTSTKRASLSALASFASCRIAGVRSWVRGCMGARLHCAHAARVLCARVMCGYGCVRSCTPTHPRVRGHKSVWAPPHKPCQFFSNQLLTLNA